MAENTRMKDLYETLKSHDQNFINTGERMTQIENELHQTLVAVNQNLEYLLRKANETGEGSNGGNGERAEGSGTERARQETYTPPHIGYQTNQQGHNLTAYIEFPEFNGENPQGWIREANRFVQLNANENMKKVLHAGYYMVGVADTWYMEYIEGRLDIDWECFCVKLLQHFTNPFEKDKNAPCQVSRPSIAYFGHETKNTYGTQSFCKSHASGLLSSKMFVVKAMSALNIFESSLRRGMFDESRVLPDGSLMERTKDYPWDSVYDSMKDVLEVNWKNLKCGTVPIVTERSKDIFGLRSLPQSPSTYISFLGSSKNGETFLHPLVFCTRCSKGRCLLPVNFRERNPQRVCDACYDRFDLLQGVLINTVSNAVQAVKYDVMDWTCSRGWLNLPMGFSMEHEIYKSANSLKSFCQIGRLNPKKTISVAVQKGAKGLAILTVVKAGVLVSYKLGISLVVVRRSDGSWSAPSAIDSVGLGRGVQFGGELINFIIVLHDSKAVKTFCSRMHFSFGAGCSAAAGPIDRVVEADRAGDKSSGMCYTYSFKKGAFVSISLEGNVYKAVDVLNTRGSSMTNLNLSSGFASGMATKGIKISILVFEVANTIVKGANLMNSLPVENVRYFKEEVLSSEGVQSLISRDMDELLKIAASDKRGELKVFLGEVVRFGNRCMDPQWHNLERYLKKLESELTPHNQLKEEAQQLRVLVQYTAELYHEMQALDRFEQDCWRKAQEENNSNSTHRGDGLAMLLAELKSPKKHVKSLKKKSLWSKILEEVMEKLVNIVHFLHWRSIQHLVPVM